LFSMRFRFFGRRQVDIVVSAYKERKSVAGVYAIRCTASDAQWVGTAPDLSTIWTRRAFALRQGVDMNKPLQSAWNLRHSGAFTPPAAPPCAARRTTAASKARAPSAISR
jgi:hypothetical protein